MARNSGQLVPVGRDPQRGHHHSSSHFRIPLQNGSVSMGNQWAAVSSVIIRCEAAGGGLRFEAITEDASRSHGAGEVVGADRPGPAGCHRRRHSRCRCVCLVTCVRCVAEAPCALGENANSAVSSCDGDLGSTVSVNLRRFRPARALRALMAASTGTRPPGPRGVGPASRLSLPSRF